MERGCLGMLKSSSFDFSSIITRIIRIGNKQELQMQVIEREEQSSPRKTVLTSFHPGQEVSFILMIIIILMTTMWKVYATIFALKDL